MDLKNASTRELVEELAKREAVEKIVVEPYEPCTVTVDGAERHGLLTAAYILKAPLLRGAASRRLVEL